jgi:hypothetical protein
VPKDIIEAYAWYNLSGANGFELGRKNLAALEKTMASTLVIEAQKRTKELLKEIESTSAAIR